MFITLGISFLLLYLCFLDLDKKRIEAWAKAMAVWCVLLFFSTEALSFFSRINQVSIFIFWMIVSLSALLWLTKKRKWLLFATEAKFFCKMLWQNKLLALFCGIVTGLSVLTVPYNWDSMTYHLTRIMNWAQNQSVAHYASHSIRQIVSPTFHEFVCLQIFLLSDKRDALFHLVQCASYFTNAWLVYEISRKLGCTEKFCKVGILLFCAMPIAFGEALTTQNDNLACVFLLLFCYYLLDFLHIDRKIEISKSSCGKVVIMSVCIGFGYLTKPTVSIGMAVMAIILLVICIIRRDSVIKLVKLLCLSVPVILAVIIPEAVRNIHTFGAIFTTITGPRQLVGTLDPRYLFINGLKNFSFNLPVDFVTNSEHIIAAVVYKAAALLCVDINHPSISEDGRIFSLGSANSMGHDTAVNAAILYISLGCFFWFLYHRKRAGSFPKLYTSMVAVLYIIICSVIRWEPFVSRYMLPYLALLCPMAVIWIEDISLNAKNVILKKFCLPIICWIGITGLVALITYHGGIISRQDMSRPYGYFTNRSDIAEEYVQVCETVKERGYELIGIVCMEDDYEYPIYYMLKRSADRIRHIMVSNETSVYEDIEYVPECIISTIDLGNSTTYHDILYNRQTEGILNVYIMQN